VVAAGSRICSSAEVAAERRLGIVKNY
jgi:hypothetical protein